MMSLNDVANTIVGSIDIQNLERISQWNAVDRYVYTHSLREIYHLFLAVNGLMYHLGRI